MAFQEAGSNDFRGISHLTMYASLNIASSVLSKDCATRYAILHALIFRYLAIWGFSKADISSFEAPSRLIVSLFQRAYFQMRSHWQKWYNANFDRLRYEHLSVSTVQCENDQDFRRDANL